MPPTNKPKYKPLSANLQHHIVQEKGGTAAYRGISACWLGKAAA